MQNGLSGCPGREAGGAAVPDRTPVTIPSASGGYDIGMVDPAAGPVESRPDGGGAEAGAQASASHWVSDIDATACRAMWCAVIAEHWNLAVLPAPAEGPAAVGSARSWFGSRDYHVVCQMAGVDGDMVLRAFHAARVPGAEYRLGITGASSSYGRDRRKGGA